MEENKEAYLRSRCKKQISSLQRKLSIRDNLIKKLCKQIDDKRAFGEKWISILDRLYPIDQQVLNQLIKELKEWNQPLRME